MSTAAILWLRRDLRLQDNPALMAAAAADRLVPVFCLDPRLLGGRHRSGVAHAVHARLPARRRSVAARPWQSRRHPPRDPGARAPGAGSGGSAPGRSTPPRTSAPTPGGATPRCQAHSQPATPSWSLHPGLFVVDDPAEIRTGDGGALHGVHAVSPLVGARAPARAAAAAALAAGPACGRQDRPDSGAEGARSHASRSTIRRPAASGAGRARLEAFLADGVDRYHERRDALAHAGTSALSPYLHFGCLSAAPGRAPAAATRRARAELRRQLCWRDFYAQVLRLLAAQRPFRAPEEVPRQMRWSRARRQLRRLARRAAPGIRWSTPRCASSGARGGSTTAAA